MTTDQFFSRPATLARLCAGPLGPHMDPLTTLLTEIGYASSTIRTKLRQVADLSHWLAEREQLMGIAPRVPGELHLDMSRKQINLAFLVVMGGMPGCIALIGLVVWRRRRQ